MTRRQLQIVQQQMREEFTDKLTRAVIVGFLLCATAELVFYNWPH